MSFVDTHNLHPINTVTDNS